jgi:uncharacterized membrane protein YhaH (DUF805 family)
MPEAGWYDDPEADGQLRWWDGSRWTEQRQPRDVPPPPPPASLTPPFAWDRDLLGADGDAGGWASSGAAPPRSFVEAIKVCLTKYVDGKGRASRSEYWYFALFTFVVGAITGGVGDLLLLLPSLTVTVRRLHDIGKSAWALLWILFPVIGWIVLIVYSIRPGEPHANRYG